MSSSFLTVSQSEEFAPGQRGNPNTPWCCPPTEMRLNTFTVGQRCTRARLGGGGGGEGQSGKGKGNFVRVEEGERKGEEGRGRERKGEEGRGEKRGEGRRGERGEEGRGEKKGEGGRRERGEEGRGERKGEGRREKKSGGKVGEGERKGQGRLMQSNVYTKREGEGRERGEEGEGEGRRGGGEKRGREVKGRERGVTYKNCPPWEKPMTLNPSLSMASADRFLHTSVIWSLAFMKNPFSVSSIKSSPI